MVRAEPADLAWIRKMIVPGLRAFFTGQNRQLDWHVQRVKRQELLYLLLVLLRYALFMRVKCA